MEIAYPDGNRCSDTIIKHEAECRYYACYLISRQRHASAAVSIAWLEAPEGSQLLLVANENFCTWQPTEKSF